MSQPLLATGRIVMPLTTSGLTHAYHAYVRNIQVGGSTYKVNTRTTDSNDLNWETAAQAFFSATSYLSATDQGVSGLILLQQLVSGVWQTISTYTPSGGFNGGGSVQPASQYTLWLRDSAYKPMKVVMLDTNQTPPQHFTIITGGDAASDNFVKQWLSTYTVTSAPYIWQVSRGDRYINTSAFVGSTVTLNRKVRRARGLA